MRITTDRIEVMCVVAEDGPAGGPAAFASLEKAIGDLRGRKFYGTYREGEYRASVATRPGDDPRVLGLSA